MQQYKFVDDKKLELLPLHFLKKLFTSILKSSMNYNYSE